jgi:hypothetical protein
LRGGAAWRGPAASSNATSVTRSPVRRPALANAAAVVWRRMRRITWGRSIAAAGSPVSRRPQQPLECRSAGVGENLTPSQFSMQRPCLCPLAGLASLGLPRFFRKRLLHAVVVWWVPCRGRVAGEVPLCLRFSVLYRFGDDERPRPPASLMFFKARSDSGWSL